MYWSCLTVGQTAAPREDSLFATCPVSGVHHNSVAYRFIAANDHPDHDTIATFRRRFLKETEALFVQVLALAREMAC